MLKDQYPYLSNSNVKMFENIKQVDLVQNPLKLGVNFFFFFSFFFLSTIDTFQTFQFRDFLSHDLTE